MRRCTFGFICLIFMLILCSCAGSRNKIEPIKSETVVFDIGIAEKMIANGEKIIADMAVRDTVIKQEYKQFISDLSAAYDGYKEVKWENMFFNNNEIEDEQLETLHLKKDMFYPTIYHQGVEVVSAVIDNTYYKDEFFNTSILKIREEYKGNSEKLKSWYREYLYKKNNENKWEFYAFGGQMNFIGEGFSPDYLKLKE